MALDLAALRQALQAKAMAAAPQEAEEIDPAVLAQLEEGAPPRDMPMQGMPPEGMGQMMDPGMAEVPQMPPEVAMAMEKERVKEMLKSVRNQEKNQEIQMLDQARSQEIEAEAQELFEQKKSKPSGY